MKLLSLQMALFTKDLMGRPDLIFAEINKKTGNLFDAMPNIVNLPIDAPPEIPIVQARSLDGKYTMNLSRNRADFIVSNKYEEDGTPNEVFRDVRIMLEKYYKYMLETNEIIRVGLVVTLFHPDMTNVKDIYLKYLKDEYREGCAEVTIHTNNQKLNKGIIFNNLRQISAMSLNNNGSIIPGVHIQYDLNNMIDYSKVIEKDTIEYVISQMAVLLKNNALEELI